jgi:hypothetical protein
MALLGVLADLIRINRILIEDSLLQQKRDRSAKRDALKNLDDATVGATGSSPDP